MNANLNSFDDQYLSCLMEYLKDKSALACAYEIGRLANAQGTSVLDLLAIHQRALDDNLRKTETRDES